ncbi:hypothetical protein MB02_15230 [Croceicoccus estronivorus]|uniref:polysaccharide deacetylase family protein n=1 Tax=Croceicoccus estronivorus TaxID=1172626 RepID=UPI00082FE48D|nr:polysaccharide deacetylase family protein [Croceicoccus estronivorus]OCC22759.1 hypothetical protein MB02_15230 [Croceicoccus estronivorus]
MLPVLITIDTEYSAGLYARGSGRDRLRNFDVAIACRGKNGEETGIHYQMDVFDRHGIRAVFFVDPMPALVWGQDAVDQVVKPIMERGHEVQLHLHTEWLAFAENNPLGDRTGRNMQDFTREEQRILLDYGAEKLVAAGAPFPLAFRAGNYGANDDTLLALADCGIVYDSSFPAGLVGGDCAVGLPPGNCMPVSRGPVAELPIAAIEAVGGGYRHGQITALSAWEMQAAVRHAALGGWPAFVLVSHSFELFNRVRGVANVVVRRRFERFCTWLGACGIARGTGFAALDLDPCNGPEAGKAAKLLPHNALRTMHRMAEQLVSKGLYG